MSSGGEESYAKFMLIAVEEAKRSLGEGNHGFGAVLVKDGTVLERARDTEVTESDPTAHAEIKLVRLAVTRGLARETEGCTVVSTHEPCPMCAGALVWARVSEIVFGTSIEQSMKLGRTMVNLGCEEVVSRAPWKVRVVGGVLASQCSKLYDSATRDLVKQFRDGGVDRLRALDVQLTAKRLAWFENNRDEIVPRLEGSEVEKAYQLILIKLGIGQEEAPITEKADDRIVFHSENRCPALDACEILGLDTRVVCKLHSEGATDALIKKLNPDLMFTRNYGRLRPESPFCEEIIELRHNATNQ